MPGDADGVPERGGFGEAFSGDGIRGSVVGRGADVAQAQRDIDGGIEFDGFERRQGLVVVEREQGIEFLVEMAIKKGVGGKAGRKAGEAFPKPVEHRVEAVALFGAENALFAGMGIESANPDAGRMLGGVEFLSEKIGGGGGAFERIASQSFRDIAERNMPSGEHDAHFFADKRHDGRAAPACGKKFGLSGEAVADALQACFVDGRGDDSGKFSGKRSRSGSFHGFESDALSGGIGRSRGKCKVAFADGDSGAGKRVQPALRSDGDERFRLGGIFPKPTGDNFRTDPGGIAARNCERKIFTFFIQNSEDGEISFFLLNKSVLK